jgi:hypothetical protein
MYVMKVRIEEEKKKKKKMIKNWKCSYREIGFLEDRVYEEKKTLQNVALYYNIIIKDSQ